jgi:hypothetical protein
MRRAGGTYNPASCARLQVETRMIDVRRPVRWYRPPAGARPGGAPPIFSPVRLGNALAQRVGRAGGWHIPTIPVAWRDHPFR